MDSSKLLGAAVLASVASLVWFTLLRRVPEQAALATILSKGYVSPHTYTQQPVEVNRNFRISRQIPIAESYAFELKLDDFADPVRASFNSVKSRQFEVGQKVRVRYVRRSFPALWERITIVDMTPVEAP